MLSIVVVKELMDVETCMRVIERAATALRFRTRRFARKRYLGEEDSGTALYVGVEQPDGDGLARALEIPQQHRILDGVGCQLAAGVTGICAQCRRYPIWIWHL